MRVESFDYRTLLAACSTIGLQMGDSLIDKLDVATVLFVDVVLVGKNLLDIGSQTVDLAFEIQLSHLAAVR